jgi:hypothetical protein
MNQYSYLFRSSFQTYTSSMGQAGINTVDDFICRHTAWFGLGSLTYWLPS